MRKIRSNKSTDTKKLYVRPTGKKKKMIKKSKKANRRK